MLHMHESLGGAFPKRHHVDCGLIAIICKVPVLGRHNILAPIWLVAKILVINEKLPTYLTFSSQFLPKFWPTQSLANFLANQLLAKIDRI
jgi:hypothetical protein